MPERAAPAPRRWLFIPTILAGSFRLFLVQPMVAHMLSRERAKFAALTGGGGWQPIEPSTASVWHDDFASILPHLTWGSFF